MTALRYDQTSFQEAFCDKLFLHRARLHQCTPTRLLVHCRRCLFLVQGQDSYPSHRGCLSGSFPTCLAAAIVHDLFLYIGIQVYDVVLPKVDLEQSQRQWLRLGPSGLQVTPWGASNYMSTSCRLEPNWSMTLDHPSSTHRQTIGNPSTTSRQSIVDLANACRRCIDTLSTRHRETICNPSASSMRW